MSKLTDAEQLLQELGITEPEEIDLEVIAWHIGVTIKRRKLDGCEARIVGAGNKAIITVNSNSAFVRQQFSIGHEIGHWYHHKGESLVCQSDEIGGQASESKTLERQADKFSSNLLLPSYILHPYLSQFNKLNFKTIKKTAKSFRTSIPATAISLVERGPWPAVLVCNGQSGRKWFIRNTKIPTHFFPKSELHYDSSAMDVLYGREPDQATPKKIGANKWFNCRESYNKNIFEQSIKTMDGDVLSLLIF